MVFIILFLGVLAVIGCGAADGVIFEQGRVELGADTSGRVVVEIGDVEDGMVRLQMDLLVKVPRRDYEAERWSTDRWSPEILLIRSGARTVFWSSFSDSFRGQSFPDWVGSFTHAPHRGSMGLEADRRQRYRVEAVFPHDAGALRLLFKWQCILQGKTPGKIAGTREARILSGGLRPYLIEGLVVERLKRVELGRGAVGALCQRVAGTDPKDAQVALRQLMSGGSEVWPMVGSWLRHERIRGDLIGVFEASVARLGADSFVERRKALIELGVVGTELLPLLNEKLESDGGDRGLSLDAKVALGSLKEKLAALAKTERQLFANRLHPVLPMWKTKEAADLLGFLPTVKQRDFYQPNWLAATEEMKVEARVAFEELSAAMEDLPATLDPLDVEVESSFDDINLSLD